MRHECSLPADAQSVLATQPLNPCDTESSSSLLLKLLNATVPKAPFDLGKPFIHDISRLISPDPVPLPSGSNDSDSDDDEQAHQKKGPKKGQRRRRRVGPPARAVIDEVTVPVTPDTTKVVERRHSSRPQRRCVTESSQCGQPAPSQTFPKLVEKLFTELKDSAPPRDDFARHFQCMSSCFLTGRMQRLVKESKRIVEVPIPVAVHSNANQPIVELDTEDCDYDHLEHSDVSLRVLRDILDSEGCANESLMDTYVDYAPFILSPQPTNQLLELDSDSPECGDDEDLTSAIALPPRMGRAVTTRPPLQRSANGTAIDIAEQQSKQRKRRRRHGHGWSDTAKRRHPPAKRPKISTPYDEPLAQEILAVVPPDIHPGAVHHDRSPFLSPEDAAAESAELVTNSSAPVTIPSPPTVALSSSTLPLVAPSSPPASPLCNLLASCDPDIDNTAATVTTMGATIMDVNQSTAISSKGANPIAPKARKKRRRHGHGWSKIAQKPAPKSGKKASAPQRVVKEIRVLNVDTHAFLDNNDIHIPSPPRDVPAIDMNIAMDSVVPSAMVPPSNMEAEDLFPHTEPTLASASDALVSQLDICLPTPAVNDVVVVVATEAPSAEPCTTDPCSGVSQVCHAAPSSQSQRNEAVVDNAIASTVEDTTIDNIAINPPPMASLPAVAVVSALAVAPKAQVVRKAPVVKKDAEWSSANAAVHTALEASGATAQPRHVMAPGSAYFAPWTKYTHCTEDIQSALDPQYEFRLAAHTFLESAATYLPAFERHRRRRLTTTLYSQDISNSSVSERDGKATSPQYITGDDDLPPSSPVDLHNIDMHMHMQAENDDSNNDVLTAAIEQIRSSFCLGGHRVVPLVHKNNRMATTSTSTADDMQQGSASIFKDVNVFWPLVSLRYKNSDCTDSGRFVGCAVQTDN